ncbi:unnamed protein product [Ranitomeya imitator]|uniref:DDE Tnp4 domain-containing protein n=1 Tax=Ranitomeya imitator TaxID=111125 RepID=A0ABN9LZX2_9NEOB|nr:unnamed protein product [Ranitomeya imitator]
MDVLVSSDRQALELWYDQTMSLHSQTQPLHGTQQGTVIRLSQHRKGQSTITRETLLPPTLEAPLLRPPHHRPGLAPGTCRERNQTRGEAGYSGSPDAATDAAAPATHNQTKQAGAWVRYVQRYSVADGALQRGYLLLTLERGRLLLMESRFPKTADDWKRIASDFEQLWQFPNCGGALDGKHVRITQPANSGSFFYNYKGYFSVILTALINANYEFVDVGMNGRVSDGGVFEHTSFGEGLRNNQLQLPQNEDTKGNLNFVFIAHEAFPLHPHLLKPFAQRKLTAERRIYNYRLFRARRVVEMPLGLWRIGLEFFHTAINLKLPSIDLVVLACCVLHNFLRRHDTSSYSPPFYFTPRSHCLAPTYSPPLTQG